MKSKQKFALITGAAGLLGKEHAIALLEENFNCILTDINYQQLNNMKKKLPKKFQDKTIIKKMDVSKEKSVKKIYNFIKKKKLYLNVLINNAAIDAKVSTKKNNINNLENLNLNLFTNELSVGLVGAVITTKYFGEIISKNKNGGSIINIGSDLSVIAPNHSIYQGGYKKPLSYSIIKHGLLGLTRYISTYWPKQKVRCNMISPGPVLQNQPKTLIKNLKRNIPMGRLASKSEYKGVIKFLSNDYSSYITGQNIIVDGGKTVW